MFRIKYAKHTSRPFSLLMCVVISALNLSAQKTIVSFGIRHLQTDVNNNLFNLKLYSSNSAPLGDGTQYLTREPGVELHLNRYVFLTKDWYANAGLAFQNDRLNFVSNYLVLGKVQLSSIGAQLGLEKRIGLSKELSLGLSAGTMLNRGMKNRIGITDAGNSELIIQGQDTTANRYVYESLYLNIRAFKICPRFELSAYCKSGKHFLKMTAFFQFEAGQYNYHAYKWGFNDYLNHQNYDAPVYNTDAFRMQVYGFSMGYCF